MIYFVFLFKSQVTWKLKRKELLLFEQSIPFLCFQWYYKYHKKSMWLYFRWMTSNVFIYILYTCQKYPFLLLWLEKHFPYVGFTTSIGTIYPLSLCVYSWFHPHSLRSPSASFFSLNPLFYTSLMSLWPHSFLFLKKWAQGQKRGWRMTDSNRS